TYIRSDDLSVDDRIDRAMIVPLLFLAFFLLTFHSVLRIHLSVRHKKRLSAAIPGDEGLPFIGNVFEFELDPQVIPLISLKRMNSMVKETGSQIMKLWFFHDNFYAPINGKTLKFILDSTEEITKGDEYSVFIPWLGTGLLTSTGAKWRSRRKMLTPTFHFTMLDGYVNTMNRHAKICVDILEDHVGQKQDIYPVVKMCALDIICETTMGKELDAQRQPHQPYIEAIGNMMTLGTKMYIKPYLRLMFIRYLLGVQQQFNSSLAIAHTFTKSVCITRAKIYRGNHENVIAERTEALRKSEVEPNNRAFLDMLLEQREKLGLTDEDIREEVDTFMFEGHDTTASAIAWAIWCFACNPVIQERVHQEIMEVLGDDTDRDLTRADMGKLSYLERCLKESMRLYPPVPSVSRRLQQDFQCGEFLLPRRANLFVSPFLLHRNESIYPNASQYDPDNFLPERVAARHAYDFVPFSAGPRNCIGQKFAQFEVNIVMSWLLRRFRFESDEPLESQKFATEVTLRPVNGINVFVHRR
ncbi:hypothetical protein PENTCL1PPCAC_14838, partial [Pristionchus entomophagus]